MNSTRMNKIARLIQKELSNIFLMEAKNLFRGAMISVTVVRVTPDLSQARVYLSLFLSGNQKEDSEEKEKVFELIRENRSKMKFELSKRLKNQLRRTPDLDFFVDDSLDYVDRIDELLK